MRRLLFLTALLSAAALRADVIVSTEWLQAHLHDRGLVVLEVGDRTTFEKGHIPGARFVELKDLAVTRGGIENEIPELPALEKLLSAAGVPSRGRIVVYARDVLHAARGFVTLDYAGCGAALSLLDGGYAKWSAEERKIETGPPAARATDFVACPRPEVIVKIAAMRKLVGEGGVSIVDARPADAFDKGHIERAESVPWDQNLTSGVTPVFRTVDDLRKLYPDDGKPVVTYCRTGMMGAVDYVALRAAGREVYLYDGGWSEWSGGEAKK